MKTILERLFHKDGRIEIVNNFKLEFLRFRKILENSRFIMSLMGDAQEKIEGEYIFDRQYVLSLIDEILEKMNMVAFDISVIAPSSSESVYTLFDKIKLFANSYFMVDPSTLKSRPKLIDFNSLAIDEEEFRLLAEVLTWIKGPLPDSKPTVLDFIRHIFEQAIPVLKKDKDSISDDSFIKTLNNQSVKFNILDLGEGISSDCSNESISIHNLKCRPLITMITGAKGKESSSDTLSNIIPEWLALITNDRLSLRGRHNDQFLLIEVTQSGYLDSDFIFAFVAQPFINKKILPPFFKTLETSKGLLGWSYNLTDRQMEESLIHLGNHLLH
ncbi:MAG: hypothetical protein HQK76_01965 [Desulfobacterales bacterium]|nr:hypothetical protein [Desulfobacterales bacterium]